jgi:DDE superfamily endonuclease
MNKIILDLYSDYLITSFSQVSATRMSQALDQNISHDTITRSLVEKKLTEKDYWKYVKIIVRQIEQPDACIALDDFIVEKEYSDENAIIGYYYDHTQNKTVKGMNIVDLAYISGENRVPLDYRIVEKSIEKQFDPLTGKWIREQTFTKHELAREMLFQAVLHKVIFKFVLMDIWFASSDNMNFIKLDLKRDFIAALKSNRKVKLVKPATEKGTLKPEKFVAIEKLELTEGIAHRARVEGVAFEVLITRQVFKNEDGSEGEMYLVTSDLSLTADQINKGYQKRWGVEEQHKSAKQNAGIGRSPVSSYLGRVNHVFCSFLAVLKLEVLRLKTGLNHFALKSKLYLRALRASMECLSEIRSEIRVL